jgi:hypothetical protein
MKLPRIPHARRRTIQFDLSAKSDSDKIEGYEDDSFSQRVFAASTQMAELRARLLLFLGRAETVGQQLRCVAGGFTSAVALCS